MNPKRTLDVGYRFEAVLFDYDDTVIPMIVNGVMTEYNKDKHNLQKAKVVIVDDEIYRLYNGRANYIIRAKDYNKIKESKPDTKRKSKPKTINRSYFNKVMISFNDEIITIDRKPMIVEESIK